MCNNAVKIQVEIQDLFQAASGDASVALCASSELGPHELPVTLRCLVLSFSETAHYERPCKQGGP